MCEVVDIVLVERVESGFNQVKSFVDASFKICKSLVNAGFTFCKSLVDASFQLHDLIAYLCDSKQDINLCEYEDSHDECDEGYPEVLLTHFVRPFSSPGIQAWLGVGLIFGFVFVVVSPFRFSINEFG